MAPQPSEAQPIEHELARQTISMATDGSPTLTLALAPRAAATNHWESYSSADYYDRILIVLLAVILGVGLIALALVVTAEVLSAACCLCGRIRGACRPRTSSVSPELVVVAVAGGSNSSCSM